MTNDELERLDEVVTNMLVGLYRLAVLTLLAIIAYQTH